MATREKAREAQRRYREAHPDKVREHQRKWRLANPDKTAAKRARYMEKHRDEVNARRREKGPTVRANSREYMKAYLRDYYEKNREVMRERAKAYYKENAEHVRAQVRNYAAAHHDKILINAREWKKRNPDAYRKWAAANKHRLAIIRNRRRAAISNAAVNDFTAEQWLQIQAAFDYRCAYCDKRCKGRLTQDHIVPISKGGSNTASNIVPACKSCNCRKHTGPPLRPVQPVLGL